MDRIGDEKTLIREHIIIAVVPSLHSSSQRACLFKQCSWGWQRTFVSRGCSGCCVQRANKSLTKVVFFTCAVSVLKFFISYGICCLLLEIINSFDSEIRIYCCGARLSFFSGVVVVRAQPRLIPYSA